MTLDRTAVDAAVDALMEAHDAQEASWRSAMDVEKATTDALQRRIDELTAPPPETYTVQAGDTLLKIGDRYHVQALRIMGWNRLGADSIIRPGDVLYLTGPKPSTDPEPEPEPEPEPAGPRFPGDPGPGRILLGAATRGGYLARITEHETAVRKRLVRRRYWNDGIGDLRPGGPVRAAIAGDHGAGRIPAPSIKPGAFGTIASGKADAALRDFIAWCEKQPLPVFFMVNHEPENDLKGKPADVQHAGAEKFRADQAHVRELITDVTGGKPKRLSFGGSLMGWNWTAAAHKGPDAILAMPDEWFPGPGVWDWCGIDQYAQKAGGPILDSKWKALVPDVQRWGVPLAVTELGIRSADPDSGNKLKAFFEQLVALGGVMLLYYDNDTNSTGEGWILDDRGGQLTVWRSLFADPRVANAAA